jgi:hypothetical protein
MSTLVYEDMRSKRTLTNYYVTYISYKHLYDST